MGKKINKAFDKLMPEGVEKTIKKVTPESVKEALAELGNKLDNSNRKLKKLELFGGDNVAIGSARPQFKPFKNLLGE